MVAGLPQGVLCATSGIDWPEGLVLGPERIAMLPYSFEEERGTPVATVAFNSTKCQFEVIVDDVAFKRELCQRRRNAMEASSTISLPPPSSIATPATHRSVAAGAGLGVGAGAGMEPSQSHAEDMACEEQRCRVQSIAAQPAPADATEFLAILQRGVRAFQEWSKGAPDESDVDFVVFNDSASLVHAAYNNPRFRHVRFEVDADGRLMITKLVDPAHEAAVAKVKTAFGNFCDAPTRRQFLYSGGGRNVFAGSGHEPNAAVYLYHIPATTPHRPRVIFEFEYGHRGPAKLQRTVRQYLSDPYVSAVLVMKVYHPRLHGERQAFAILFTRAGPQAAWDIGDAQLAASTKTAFAGLPADGLLPLLPGVPAAMWVRRGCNIVHPAPGPFIVQYAVPPGRPVCNIQERLFYHVPPGGGGVVQAIMPAAAAVLAIDLGDVLAAFLSAGP